MLRVRALQADSTVTLHLTIDPCDTNGINENGMANLTLYPNPTTGMVNVQFTMNNVQSGAGEIQMLDVYGRLLQTVETCHGASLQTTQIDLSHYATGIYFVRMVNGGKVMAVRKVVKE
ncbi:MAG: T9SS type A sorting domain-containing protein [Bacteroidales bacterium]|nr:T9SS type A sorting domain-containing protein [Bacteroidales bacterium]